jgi:hypothetical protein
MSPNIKAAATTALVIAVLVLMILLTMALNHGCVQPNAVVGVERGGVVVPVASPNSSQTTSQPVTAHVAPTAGGDAKTVTIQVPITASGSGWPIALAVVGIVGIGVVVYLWREKRIANGQTVAVAQAIRGSPKEARDAVLDRVKNVPGKAGFDKMLQQHGAYVVRPKTK